MRYFKLVTHLTVPRSLLPGIGNTHERPEPGDVIPIEDEACARESRFINGRTRAVDMKETDEAEYLAFVKAREAKAQESEPATTPAPASAEAPAPAAKSAKGK